MSVKCSNNYKKIRITQTDQIQKRKRIKELGKCMIESPQAWVTTCCLLSLIKKGILTSIDRCWEDLRSTWRQKQKRCQHWNTWSRCFNNFWNSHCKTCLSLNALTHTVCIGGMLPNIFWQPVREKREERSEKSWWHFGGSSFPGSSQFTAVPNYNTTFLLTHSLVCP